MGAPLIALLPLKMSDLKKLHELVDTKCAELAVKRVSGHGDPERIVEPEKGWRNLRGTLEFYIDRHPSNQRRKRS